MASKCFMCGRETTGGILCDKCDKPRKSRGSSEVIAAQPSLDRSPDESPVVEQVREQVIPAATPQPPSIPAGFAPPRVTGRGAGGPQSPAAAMAIESFPEASILPFPVESASPSVTSLANVLIAAGVAAVLVAPDRSVKFVTDEARALLGISQTEGPTLKLIELVTGVRVGELALTGSAAFRLLDRNHIYSLVPLSGGAGGAVIVFRPAEAMNESHASFLAYVRETVLTPLRSLRESMSAAAADRPSDPLFDDALVTIEGILSSIDMAPEVEQPRLDPLVTDVVREVSARFRGFAELKNIQLQVDAVDLPERLHDQQRLAEALGVLMDNAFHYVPPGGQVVIGARMMEHKGKPLLLFFVMDNGPLVPEHLRQTIFDASFEWQPASSERSGRNLAKCREFALAHGGQVWVESKSGKACTFFLRVRPDGVV